MPRQEAPPPAALAEEGSGSISPQQLRQFLAENFNDSELRTLCFNLEVPYEDLSGSGKEDKVRELIEYCQRRGQYNKLVAACTEARPSTFVS
jgi:hypothetical protein